MAEVVVARAMPELINASRDFVKQYMEHYDSSHDFSHIRRVLSLARHIETQEVQRSDGLQYNSDIITLAALLHDVGDRKYLKPGQDGTTMVLEFLIAWGADAQLAQTVQDIVNRVSYSAEIKDPSVVTAALAKYPELAVVQDADRLDALGSIGIGRCFSFNACRSSQAGMNNAIEHFSDKLLKLQDMMKTQTGREMAVERSHRISIFRGWWLEECGLESGNDS